MSHNRQRCLLLAACLLNAAVAVSCKSTNKSGGNVPNYDWKELDAQLPDGSTATPSHTLSRYEYPFDASGRYVSSWAAEGERRHGRSAYASSSSSRRKSSSSSSRKSSTKYRYHKVTAGDTLYGLSRRYGTSVSAIKRANGLKSDLIINGRTLKIPR